MNNQPTNQETMTVFYLAEGRIAQEFEIPIKPYDLNNELDQQSTNSVLETAIE